MNISRITNYRALILAAEAGALNVTASTPEDEARVKEIIAEAESSMLQEPEDCSLLIQMLSGVHHSDGKRASEIFPTVDFSCYRGVYSSCSCQEGVWGIGSLGNNICARALSRYQTAVEELTFKESMRLLANLIFFLNKYHRNTGLGDTEPENAITVVVNQIFKDLGFKEIYRNEWQTHFAGRSATV